MTLDVKIGLIAGSGRLPELIVQKCYESGQEIHIIQLKEAEAIPRDKVIFTAFRPSEIFAKLRSVNCTVICFAGNIKRPLLNPFKLDWFALRHLPKLIRLYFKGDDGLLRGLTAIIEKQGFTVIGPHELLQNALAQAGVLGEVSPNAVQMHDIQTAKAAAQDLGRRDIGQAVIMRQGQLIANEDKRGTAAMIEDYANNDKAESGVLYKAPKPQQDWRIDLPAIGPDTIIQAHAAGLCGVAIEAGGVLLIDKTAIIAAADGLGLFIYGLEV